MQCYDNKIIFQKNPVKLRECYKYTAQLKKYEWIIMLNYGQTTGQAIIDHFTIQRFSEHVAYHGIL